MAGLTPRRRARAVHDIYHVVKRGQATEQEQVRVAGWAQMVGLAFAVVSSANFPALLMSIVWRDFTTAGAVVSILTGSILTVFLIVISPTAWVDILHNREAIPPSCR